MKVYLDTSVILRVLFHEPDRITEWGRWTEAYSSRLWRTEALRTVERLRLEGRLTDDQMAQLRTDIDLVHETLYVVPIAESVLERASEAFPTVVGTLDAIHLASAIAVRETTPLDALLTHDYQQATAARSLGFNVRGA